MKTKVDITNEQIQEILNKDKVQYFLGGSRRWGNNGPLSDYDYFIRDYNEDECSIFFQVIDKLNQYGFSWKNTPNIDKYTFHSQIQVEGCIYLTFIEDEINFNELKEEHIKMEPVMKSFPSLILTIKNHGVDGKTIYRIMRDWNKALLSGLIVEGEQK